MTKPKTAPIVKPDVKPAPAKKPFDPIRRNKPSVTPAPKAKSSEDVVNRFMDELKNNPDQELELDLEKLKNKYSEKKD